MAKLRRQKALPGMEKQTNKELDAAAEAYVAARDDRMAKSEDEALAKQALIDCMRKHKVEVYRDESVTPSLIVTIVPGKDGVKVSQVEEGEEEPVE